MMNGQDGIEQPEIVRTISLLGRKVTMPQSRMLRVSIGVMLVIGGMLGFLPVLGFWMLPLGLLVLSYEFARVRRWRRRSTIWWSGKREARQARAARRRAGSR